MAEIQNIPAVTQAIKKAAQERRDRLAVGLLKAGKLLEKASREIVPVDYGKLKASSFTRIQGKGTANPCVTVGYTARYALYVHENLEAAHGERFNLKYEKELAAAAARKKKGGKSVGPFRHNRGKYQSAKFLERPYRHLKADLVKVVKTEVSK